MIANILIVGAGFAGAVIARQLADSGRFNVKVIDRRDHIAGNAYDPINPDLNLRVHQYGPHIFHTNDQRIFDYLSRFTEWLPYRHQVQAWVDDVGYVPLPINRTTINRIYRQSLYDEEAVKVFLSTLRIPNENPSNARQVAENVFGPDLTELFFGRYTRKMWDLDLTELPAEVLKRLPIRYDDNADYFNDSIQAMPADGYIGLFKKLLDHPAISIVLNCEFDKAMEHEYFHVFNSMPIDVYFDECFGRLPYRSIKFEHQLMPEHHQPTPTINFTDDGCYTRQTDWRLYPGCNLGAEHVLLTKEMPCRDEDNRFERYYPVKTVSGEPQQLYKRYKAKAEQLKHMTFIGRCGQYIYYDMHQVVANSLKIAQVFLERAS
ncbi:UDP-galactopyranose mutase [Methylomonas sp. UP202]|uniref:UDP-galactopyranose mutase n=1 Tax=Methylomonas sp. UP202 TaxID=3040943 RepID=UPI00247A8F08|nr:UDP-galactopyranose mutase [Methylomonas sp. UP202]WGS83783.1 UDP-galactopyranose mutase [Methylomonas sp. UP202]